MTEVEVIAVVRTTLERRGRGVPGDPYRRVTQFWSLDGGPLAEVDSTPAGMMPVTQVLANPPVEADGNFYDGWYAARDAAYEAIERRGA